MDGRIRRRASGILGLARDPRRAINAPVARRCWTCARCCWLLLP
jgi:hypothetical protein